MKPTIAKLGKKGRETSHLDIAWAMVWGVGALLFSVSAVGAIFFSSSPVRLVPQVAGVQLPPIDGEIRSTGAIARDGETLNYQVYPSEGGLAAQQQKIRIESDIEVLRREVSSLRRSLIILQERDSQLSRKLDELSRGKAISVPQPSPDSHDAKDQMVLPETGKMEELEPPMEDLTEKQGNVETMPAPELTEHFEVSDAEQAVQNTTPDGVSAKNNGAKPPAAEFRKPVRIVALPAAGDPQSVGSIPKLPAPNKNDDTHQQQTPVPIAKAAGNISGDSDGRLGRTNFAIDLGIYSNAAAAKLALAGLKDEIASIGGQMTPLASAVTEPSTHKGATDQSFRLLLGPFPNAADAATACVLLSASSHFCRPTAYIGKPL